MSKKSSVYFGPPMMAHTGNLASGDSVSGRLNRTVDRYMEICKRHALALNDAELQILAGVLSGSLADNLLIRHLADELLDSDYVDAPEGMPLVTRLREASFVELVATVEQVEAFISQ